MVRHTRFGSAGSIPGLGDELDDVSGGGSSQAGGNPARRLFDGQPDSAGSGGAGGGGDAALTVGGASAAPEKDADDEEAETAWSAALARVRESRAAVATGRCFKHVMESTAVAIFFDILARRASHLFSPRRRRVLPSAAAVGNCKPPAALPAHPFPRFLDCNRTSRCSCWTSGRTPTSRRCCTTGATRCGRTSSSPSSSSSSPTS
jgi:hypothetical protein